LKEKRDIESHNEGRRRGGFIESDALSCRRRGTYKSMKAGEEKSF
jgi:hypothetical protein